MKTKKFEISEHLGDEAAIADYLDACMEEGGQELFLKALGDAVKAMGVQDVARKAGISSRSSFYRSLVPTSNPKLATIGSVLDSMGLRLAVVTKDSAHAP
jgi:probable addiction module antidote protein